MVPARCAAACFATTALLGFAALPATAQQPAAAQPNESVEMHLAAAKDAAGLEFTGTLSRLCITPQTAPNPDRPRGNAPPPQTWYTEPAKIFDNLYFVGSLRHSAWALTTSEGIILIDTLYDYASEALIPDGLKKLGLDPADVKYTLISHGHGDHVGGALMMQEKYKSRIVMGDKDWTMVNSYVLSFPNGTPKRDIVAKDGDKITLGDTSVTLVSTPGHTPDTYSFIFQVKDNGKPLTVAYNGGTAFNFVNDVPHFDIYIASQRKMREAAAAAGATVLLTNHSEFDNATTKIRLMAARKEGEPSPFELGARTVQRYFRVMEECAKAARLKLVRGEKPTVAVGSPAMRMPGE